jgi:heat shock protein HslJ
MKYFIFLFTALIAFGCSSKLSPDAGWARQRWIVVEMKGVPVQQSGSRRDAYINFEVNEKKFVGNGGCNQLNGNYSISKSSISFNDVISTKMSCEDIAFEEIFLSTLSSVDRYEVRDNDLLLKKKRETVLILRSR